jgi:hypothetical protein
MAFHKDDRIAMEAMRGFGEYIETFVSKTGQVRADLFRRGRIVVAHVSFPTGMEPNTVKDPYVGELWQYARDHDFADNFKLVIS